MSIARPRNRFRTTHMPSVLQSDGKEPNRSLVAALVRDQSQLPSLRAPPSALRLFAAAKVGLQAVQVEQRRGTEPVLAKSLRYQSVNRAISGAALASFAYVLRTLANNRLGLIFSSR